MRAVNIRVERKGQLRKCCRSVLGRLGSVLEWVGWRAGDEGKMSVGPTSEELGCPWRPLYFSLNSPRRQSLVLFCFVFLSFRACLT